jgi:Glycosyl hydrolases family 16
MGEGHGEQRRVHVPRAAVTGDAAYAGSRKPSAVTRNADPGPNGVPGTWRPTFSDDFDSSALDRSTWSPTWFGGSTMNGKTVLASNVRVADSALVLSLDSLGRGAVVTSNPTNGDIGHGFEFGTGVVVEARVQFDGSGSEIDNWPAWWTDGQDWPVDGEVDIVEALQGRATSNYHWQGGQRVSDPIDGEWGGGWHTYAVDREPGRNTIYWDGRVVSSYRTDDGGSPHYLLFTNVPRDAPSTSRAAELKVDYVRAWAATPPPS